MKCFTHKPDFRKDEKDEKEKKSSKADLWLHGAGVTFISGCISDDGFCAESPTERVPYYEEVKDQLDMDEVVTAHDYEVTVGASFDINCDFSGIEIPDNKKVKVTFQEALNEDGDPFATDHEDTYRAVYYVEPQTTSHPMYQISRNITVKEAAASEEVKDFRNRGFTGSG